MNKTQTKQLRQVKAIVKSCKGNYKVTGHSHNIEIHSKDKIITANIINKLSEVVDFIGVNNITGKLIASFHYREDIETCPFDCLTHNKEGN